jgi:REP element-mobilizing transposase RayT
MTDRDVTSGKCRNRGWYRRGEHNLPHFDDACTQFITFRLFGSLPKEWFERLKEALQFKQITIHEYHKKIESRLDAGEGPCWLSKPRIARVVQDALIYFHNRRYILHRWSIMPNHVHLLITILPANSLPNLIRSIKRHTAANANRLLSRSGVFWQRDYFDRYIRNAGHFDYAISYIDFNPVKAKLCATPENWPFSGAGIGWNDFLE